MKPMPCTASGERTSIPNRTPHQVKANIPSATRPTSSTPCSERSGAGLQPSASPKATVITRPSTCSQNWPITSPVMIDSRLTGIERKRSITPSVMSVAVAVPAPITPKASDWPMIPGNR